VASTGGPSVQAETAEDAVVARVGPSTITAGELSRRLLSMPPFQLKMFGKTEDEIKRTFLERVLVRDLLLAQGAVDQKLDAEDNVEERARATLRGAMLQQIRLEALSEPISDQEVEKYYNDNADKFHAPERLGIWRILVATREDALSVIEEWKKDSSATRWNVLARERSLDKATNMRGGNLGYVSPDGKTGDAAIVVDAAVIELAKTLKEAELSQVPVKEGDKWAVVWRRGTMKPVDRPLAQEAPGIRQTLARQRTENKLKALLDTARKEHVHDLTPDFVDELTVSAQGDLQPVKRPGVLPARRAAPGLPQPGHDHR
jgi:peptidyl-prolyl cis-trans isomerase C